MSTVSAGGLIGDKLPAFYPGRKPASITRAAIAYGHGRGFAMRKGDLCTLINVDGGAAALLSVIGDNSNSQALALIGLEQNESCRLSGFSFHCPQFDAFTKTRGLKAPVGTEIFDNQTEADERFTFRASADCQLFVMLPLNPDALANGGGGAMVLEIQHQSKPSIEFALPDPLGKVVDEWRVPRASAFAYEVKKGQYIQVIDVEGQQCSDFMAMRASALDQGLERFIDGTVTRSLTAGAYPRPGSLDKFFDQDMRPLLALVQDTVGRHDTFALACTARGYEERGFPGHINCSDNISRAYEPFGIQERRAWPAVNFFFNSWINHNDNNLASDEAWSRSGDYVCMKALTDLVCVSTACPDDVDPINNWDPTDVHLRVYEEDSAIQKSMYYRATPTHEGTTTQYSAFHERTSALTEHFIHARDMWLPARFDASDAIGEYWALKNTATLQDMSSLRKFDVMGPDAEKLLQHCLTRDVTKLAVHRGFYALVCDKRGAVLDDGTLFRLAPDVFRWCCGSDNSGLHLQEQAEALGLRVWVKSLSHNMPNLALQGPKSFEILKNLVFTQPTRPSIENVKWFGMTIGRLNDRDGVPFMLCRSGFTGELGYEIFCDAEHALEIWDAVSEAGAPHGLKPMGGEALEMVRIEAGLMAAGAEFGPDVDAFESGLGFAVDLRKESFMGHEALRRNAEAPRRVLMGLKLVGDDLPGHGDGVFDGREQVGVVTSATRSPALGHSIAMARLAVENAEVGMALEVGRLDGHMKRLAAEVVALPFIDPKREKARVSVVL